MTDAAALEFCRKAQRGTLYRETGGAFHLAPYYVARCAESLATFPDHWTGPLEGETLAEAVALIFQAAEPLYLHPGDSVFKDGAGFIVRRGR